MRSAVEFFEAYWLPLFLGSAAIALLVIDAPIGALLCAFAAGTRFSENP